MRKFSDREKQAIQSKLLEKGRELFAAFGLKKTSVTDLTKGAGIAQGSFYLFYESKEELYFDILEQEEEAIRSRLTEKYFTEEKMTKAVFKRFLLESFAILEENPLIKQLHDEELTESLFRKLPEEKLKQHFADDSSYLDPLIARGQAEGWMVDRNSEAIVSLIRSIVLLALQKRQIGEERYADTIELLIDLIADGLIIEAQ